MPRTTALTASHFGADPIDEHIGRRLRVRRTLMGISQQELAEAIGVTFQQVQKYERGTNRISGSRLFDVACALQVPVSYFYDDIDEATVAARMERAKLAHKAGHSYTPPAIITSAGGEDDPMTRTENLEMVRDVAKLPPEKQEAVRAFLAVICRRD